MDTSIDSPCDMKCELNELNYCTSCFRSVHEIYTWKTMEQEERDRILGEITAIKLFLAQEIGIIII